VILSCAIAIERKLELPVPIKVETRVAHLIVAISRSLSSPRNIRAVSCDLIGDNRARRLRTQARRKTGTYKQSLKDGYPPSITKLLRLLCAGMTRTFLRLRHFWMPAFDYEAPALAPRGYDGKNGG
jgi:hypothetical protein